MKLLDRYVAGSFIRNYLISFFVLVGMFVALDMVIKFHELVEVNTKMGYSGLAAVFHLIRYTADFYFYQSLLYFLYLGSVIPVVAAAFTIMRMVRFNELGALLSTGVPMLRVAAPMVVVALVLNGLVWVDQEMVIPKVISKLVRKPDYGVDVDWFQVNAMHAGETRGGEARLFASRFYPRRTRRAWMR